MTATIYDHSAMVRADQRWNLIAPIAAMAEAAMQKDHGRAGPECRVPNSSTVVINVALLACDRQGGGTMRFEIRKVVVV